MITFKQYLKESQSVVGVSKGHMSHVEDLVFDLGVEGTRLAINFLRDVRDMLSQGSGNKSTVASVKFDGCVHEDTVLWTSMGDMTIRKLVEHPELWESIKLMGKDVDSDMPITKLAGLIDAHKSTPKKDWIEVFLEGGESIKLTVDHEVHTSNRGWVEAQNLVEGDDITEM